MHSNSVALLLALSLSFFSGLAGCGGSDDDDSLDGVDVAAESAEVATRGGTPTDQTMVKGVTELLVQEDPTVDPSASAGANADSIAAQATARSPPARAPRWRTSPARRR